MIKKVYIYENYSYYREKLQREELFAQIRKAIRAGNSDAVISLGKQVIDMDIDPIEIINQCTDEMRKIGKEFEDGIIFLPELMMAAEAFKTLAETLTPKLQAGKERKYLGKVVIATVFGDVHDLGKNIVATMLEAEGFQVFNLGRDVPASEIINKAKEVDADIIGASALMTTTMIEQKKIKEEIVKAGLDKRVKYLIGGAVTSSEWAKEIGAIRGEDASDAVKKAKQVLGIGPFEGGER
jgi:corrinoid protein of di/trimethylamine methyltransferase